MIAAIILCAVLGAIALFQLALILGAPLGEFAWGGADRVLPGRKRIGSTIAIVLYAAIAWIVLMKADLLPAVLPEVVVSVGAWVVTAYFAVGIVLNAASKSRKERYTMTPVVALLTALSLVVALG